MNLHDRLIQLEVDIDDKIKSIELTVERIETEEKAFDHEYQALSEEYRVQLHSEDLKYKASLAEQTKSCSDLLEQKKCLIHDIESLLKRKQEEEDITRKLLADIQTKHANRMKKAYDEWKETLQHRNEEWIHQRSSKLHEATVKALEPNLSRLLDEYKGEVDAIKTEYENKKKYISEKLSADMDMQYAEYKSEQEQRYRITVQEIKDHWMQKNRRVEEDHQQNLLQLRSRLEHDLTEKRQDHASVLQRMEVEHHKTMSALKEATEKKAENIAREQSKSQVTSMEERKKAIHDLTVKLDEEKKTWERQVLLPELEKEYEEKILEAKKSILQRRDAKILEFVTTRETEALLRESQLKTKLDLERASLLKDHQKKIDDIVKVTSQWNALTIEAQEERDRLMNEHSKICGDIQIEEEKIRNIESEIAKYSEQIIMIETKTAHKIEEMMYETKNELSLIQAQRTELERQITFLEGQEDQIMRYRQTRLCLLHPFALST